MCTQVRHCLTKLNCCTPRSSACVIGLLYTGLVFVARSYSVNMLRASRLQYCGGWSQQRQEACVRLREAPPILRTRVAWHCDEDCGSAPLQRLSPNCLRAGCAAAKMLLAAGSFEIS